MSFYSLALSYFCTFIFKLAYPLHSLRILMARIWGFYSLYSASPWEFQCLHKSNSQIEARILWLFPLHIDYVPVDRLLIYVRGHPSGGRFIARVTRQHLKELGLILQSLRTHLVVDHSPPEQSLSTESTSGAWPLGYLSWNSFFVFFCLTHFNRVSIATFWSFPLVFIPAFRCDT